MEGIHTQDAMEKYLAFLDALRESGKTTLLFSGPLLCAAYPELTEDEASEVLLRWFDTFSKRHPPQKGSSEI